MPELEMAREGEIAAFFYLRRLGSIVVAREWTSGLGPGNIDLIAWEGETLCFVEVSTQRTREEHPSHAALPQNRQLTLHTLAKYYLRQVPPGTSTRFDLLHVHLQEEQELDARARRSKEKLSSRFEYLRNAF